jgi:Protein of Unknown function (DUF2784)
VLVTITVAIHFGFVAYVVAGGFLALKWPRTLALHLFAVLWGIGSVALHWPCPLTWLERWARTRADMRPLPPEGFIAHYISGVLYPADAAAGVQALVAVTVAIAWILAVRRLRGRTRSAASPAP